LQFVGLVSGDEHLRMIHDSVADCTVCASDLARTGSLRFAQLLPIDSNLTITSGNANDVPVMTLTAQHIQFVVHRTVFRMHEDRIAD
jgi:hypothetical protein